MSLRQCPFCGTSPMGLQLLEDADDNPYIKCMTCLATGPLADNGYTWDDRADDGEEGR